MSRVAIWAPHRNVNPRAASELEQIGYSTLWLGSSPDAELGMVDALLAATERLIVGTSIVNIWASPPERVAASFYRLDASYPGRVVLGIGVGHPEATREYRKPYAAAADYLDRLDEHGVPAQRRALGALGPRMLDLARTRTAGALPYLVTPEYTRGARVLLGPDALLVAEQKIVLDDNPARGREIGRERVRKYLRLSSYVATLRRIGFGDEDLEFPGSDRLVDALAVHGDLDVVVAALRAHLAMGADQVAVQVLAPDNDFLRAARALAGRI
jgi:probable F420-dependent oxidoreductase